MTAAIKQLGRSGMCVWTRPIEVRLIVFHE